MKKVVTLANGQRRTLTGDVLVKGLAKFSKQHKATQARAFDAGVQAAKHIVANNALADALRANASNQTANRTARAIDSLFDAPAPAVKNQPLLDALDSIVPQRAQALDDAIDGITTAAPQPLSQVIEDL